MFLTKVNARIQAGVSLIGSSELIESPIPPLLINMVRPHVDSCRIFPSGADKINVHVGKGPAGSPPPLLILGKAKSWREDHDPTRAVYIFCGLKRGRSKSALDDF